MKKWKLRVRIRKLEDDYAELEETSTTRINDLTAQRGGLQKKHDWLAAQYKSQGEQAAQAKKELNDLLDAAEERIRDLEKQLSRPQGSLLSSHHRNCECGCKYKQGPTQ